jgi:hypothetical protein
VKGAPPPAAGGPALKPESAFAGLADSLASLATFVGAERVTLGRVVPAKFRAPLARALRAASPAPHRTAGPGGVDDQVPV